MVCIETEPGETKCIIYDTRPIAVQKKFTLVVRTNYTVEKLFVEVNGLTGFENFDLSFGDLSLNKERDKKLTDIGVKFDQGPNYRNEISLTELGAKISKIKTNNSHSTTDSKSQQNNHINNNGNKNNNDSKKNGLPKTIDASLIEEMKIDPDIGISSDDDLALGASASPTESSSIPVPPTPPTFALPAITDGYASSSTFKRTYDNSAITFVGLVNQAMTCYLNSLLQALYMTPEFRNALYNWEFDGKDEAKSIPYQLQKLFLNLQTSSKSVETTDLTHSFGWERSEAWQQHDIQELCRVMFDALENRFKNTKQADLINRLYSGKMIDYVKCLDCSTEKQREDTFLDIPLPVRPFGSIVSYESVGEALSAFVQPETLDGNNQYFCEKCNRKCDAHKGLKFTKFPYILTLHLKRFDFDYQTLHRIKLNDKVTFPQMLNVNDFICNLESTTTGATFTAPSQQNGGSDTASIGQESGIENNSVTKCDDCSTTDSGSALEEDSCNGGTSIPSSGTNDQDLQDDDEGIDMGGGDAATKNGNNSGPYCYDLFAIMIHSGSASGGHYYAYIKDFETNKWYSFNDQTVSHITQEDIQKSFGGSSTKNYYSSAYSSSTNAYMLMYRQSDPQRNTLPIKEEDFPEHIKALKLKMKKEENEKKIKDLELEMTKLKIYFHNPKQKRLVDVRVTVTLDATLEETLQEAYNRLAIKTYAPVEHCRLVAFDHSNETIECSLEGKEHQRIGDVLNSIRNTELLLEVRDSNSVFEVYAPGGIMLKIYTIDMATMDIEGPLLLRVCKTDTIRVLKQLICKKYELNYEQILMVINRHGGSCSYPKRDDETLENEMLNPNCKIIVAINVGPQQQHAETALKLDKIVDETFQHILTLFFQLPNTEKDNLEKLLIPSYEPSSSAATSPSMTAAKVAQKQAVKSFDCVDAQCYANPVLAASLSCRIPSPLPPIELPSESNSEDSSLSDSDRTLVEAQAAQDDISSNSNSPAWSEPRLSSPEEWMHGTATSSIAVDHSPQHHTYDDDDMNNNNNDSNQPLYFKAMPYEEPAIWEGDETQKMIKVYTHKQMLIKDLKRELEPYVKVPQEYFKIFKLSVDNQAETECVRLTENLFDFKDGERLQIELGRALRDGEYKCKLYFLKLSEFNDDVEQLPYLCETILRNGAEVGVAKREILAHIATLDPKYKIPYEKCRLRRKTYKNASKVYQDDQKFGEDIILTTNMEMVLQEMEATSQPSTDPDDVVLFCRRWHPSTLTLGEFQEITIEPNGELKQVISKMSGIPDDNLEYNKMSGNSSRFNTSILNIQDLVWSSHSNSSISVDGTLILYRDKTEPVKELTDDERRELTNKENARLGVTSASSYTTSYSSRRRERALKIYIDPSPKKNEE